MKKETVSKKSCYTLKTCMTENMNVIAHGIERKEGDKLIIIILHTTLNIHKPSIIRNITYVYKFNIF